MSKNSLNAARNDLNHYLQLVWDARRSFLMDYSNGGKKPTLLVIHPALEHEIVKNVYENRFNNSTITELMPCSPDEPRKLFGMRLIVSRDLKEDEIIIK